jgi:hypothetical protein
MPTTAGVGSALAGGVGGGGLGLLFALEGPEVPFFHDIVLKMSEKLKSLN